MGGPAPMSGPVIGVQPPMEDDGSLSAEPPSPGVTRAPLSITVLDPNGLLDPELAAWVGSRAGEALAHARSPHGDPPQGQICARLVDDPTMANAHQRWKETPGTTDVLTFDLSEASETSDADGPIDLDVDVLLCVDEGRRQAAERGHGVQHELVLYLVHAALHCLGHDDHTEDDAARMHAEEDRLLGLVGVGPVFGVRPHDATGSDR